MAGAQNFTPDVIMALIIWEPRQNSVHSFYFRYLRDSIS